MGLKNWKLRIIRSKKITFDTKEHYSNCQTVYHLANQLQRERGLDPNDERKLQLCDYVEKVRMGCQLIVKKNQNVNVNGQQSANDKKKEKRAVEEFYKEYLKMCLTLCRDESRIGLLVAELNSKNKTNSLHELKRIINNVRNPCNLDQNLYPVLYQ
jgi:hypothetical protein